MNEQWIKQEDGTYKTENSSGEFTIDENGKLMKFVPGLGPLEGEVSEMFVDIVVEEYVRRFTYAEKDKLTVLKDLVIPDGVTQIGEWDSENPVYSSRVLASRAGIFKDYVVIEKLAFPNSLSCIGIGEFQRCSLPNVKLPSSLKIIGYYAFHATKINNLIFNPNFQCIGGAAFSNCLINSVIIPECLGELRTINYENNFDKELHEGYLLYTGRNFKEAMINSLYIPESSSHLYNDLFTETKIEILSKYSKILLGESYHHKSGRQIMKYLNATT